MKKINCAHCLDWAKLQWLCSLPASGHNMIVIRDEGKMRKLNGTEVVGVLVGL